MFRAPFPSQRTHLMFAVWSFRAADDCKERTQGFSLLESLTFREEAGLTSPLCLSWVWYLWNLNIVMLESCSQKVSFFYTKLWPSTSRLRNWKTRRRIYTWWHIKQVNHDGEFLFFYFLTNQDDWWPVCVLSSFVQRSTGLMLPSAQPSPVICSWCFIPREAGQSWLLAMHHHCLLHRLNLRVHFMWAFM